MNLIRAREIAEKYRAALEPYCIEGMCRIAGSVRREKPEVKDIEIVVYPNTALIFKYLETVKQFGFKTRGQFTGRYSQYKLDESICLDLFRPSKEDYFRQFAIRTGSNSFSAKIIAAAWVKKGWRGTEDGLRLEKECMPIKNNSIDADYNGIKIVKWKCAKENPALPPVWKSEEEFFEWLGLKFIPPSQRER